MASSSNLNLPFILPAQAQKHVTHNEALRKLDALVHISIVERDSGQPPTTPTQGERYIVGPSPSGLWQDRENQIAAWQDETWVFYPANTGWLAWIEGENILVGWDGNNWSAITSGSAGSGGSQSLNPAPLIGVNATADTTNRLSVTSPSILFNAETDDMRITVNKQALGNTASFLFQSGFNGRAEIGLTGDDQFHFRVTPDGVNWKDAIIIDEVSGEVSMPFTNAAGITDAQIKTAYENNPDTNAFSDVEQIKLTSIASNATIDMSDTQIKTAYENNTNTNVFTDTQQTKLLAIEANATADQTDVEIEAAYNNQVDQINISEITAGTETAARRISPKDIADMVVTHAPVGSGGATDPQTGINTADIATNTTAIATNTATIASLDSGGGGSSPISTAVKTTDEGRANTTTLTNDAHLFLPVEANTIYGFTMTILHSGSSQADSKISFTAPANAELAWTWDNDSPFAIRDSLNTIRMVSTASSNRIGTFLGVLTVGDIAGVLRLLWAQNTLRSTPTVFAKGTYIKLVKL